MPSSLKAAIMLGAMFCAQLQAGVTSCHLHAPDNYATFSKQPLIIPAVGNEAECEQLNQQRFDATGRCHCVVGPTRPRTLGPSDFREPGDSPEQLP